MTEFATVLTPLDDLTGNDANPKSHDRPLIAESLRRFGFIDPIVVDDRTGLIVSGHGRVATLRDMREAGDPAPDGVTVTDGAWSVPTVRGWASANDDEAAAALIALNQTTTAGGWNESVLLGLLERLKPISLDGVGFDDDAIAGLRDKLARMKLRKAEPESDPDELSDLVPSTTVRGTVFGVGPHRLMCGDSTNPADVARLLDGRKVDLIVTSPPYNVGIQYGEHDDATTRGDYLELMRSVLAAWLPHLATGRFVAWNVGVYAHPYAQAVLLEQAGLTFYRQIVWKKPGVHLPLFHMTRNNPKARRYTPNAQHEMVYLFTSGKPVLGDTIALPDGGEDDVWDHIPGSHTRDLPDAPQGAAFHATLDQRTNKAHPATFPVALPSTLIGYLTQPGEVVGDPFAGAFTTHLACQQSGRVGVGMDIDPAYVDLGVRRLTERYGLAVTTADLKAV